MRSKAPLALMEQMIMVLVFALAAALCLRVFVSADSSSQQRELRDRALTEGQSMAELTKANSGNLAFLYTPAEFPAPPCYEFALYHLMVVEDLVKPFPITWIQK